MPYLQQIQTPPMYTRPRLEPRSLLEEYMQYKLHNAFASIILFKLDGWRQR